MMDEPKTNSVILLRWIEEHISLLQNSQSPSSIAEAEALERITGKVLQALEKVATSQDTDADTETQFRQIIPLFRGSDADICDLIVAGAHVKELIGRLVAQKTANQSPKVHVKRGPTEPLSKEEIATRQMMDLKEEAPEEEPKPILPTKVKSEPSNWTAENHHLALGGLKLEDVKPTIPLISETEEEKAIREEQESEEFKEAISEGGFVLHDSMLAMDEQRDMHIRMLRKLLDDDKMAISLSIATTNYGFPTMYNRLPDIAVPEEAYAFVDGLDQLINALHKVHLEREVISAPADQRECIAQVVIGGSKYDFLLELDHQGRQAWFRVSDIPHGKAREEHEFYVYADLLAPLRNRIAELLEEFDGSRFLGRVQ